MLPLLVLSIALVGLFFFFRRGKKKAAEKHEGPLPSALDGWVAEALAKELRRIDGLDSDLFSKKLVGTLAGEPDPDVVSAIAEAVRQVDLEVTRYPHEGDCELAVVVRYENGREGRVTRRVTLAELPTDVVDEMATRAVTRVFRPWSFSWER